MRARSPETEALLTATGGSGPTETVVIDQLGSDRVATRHWCGTFDTLPRLVAVDIPKRKSKSRLQSRLEDFLVRLGRTVETPREGLLIAKHQTALVAEEMRFRVVDSARDKPLKSATNIVAPHLPLPDQSEYPTSFYFEEFLDRTVQARRLSQSLLEDPQLCQQREFFVPQHIRSQGEAVAADAVDYFCNDWLPDDERRLLAVLAPRRVREDGAHLRAGAPPCREIFACERERAAAVPVPNPIWTVSALGQLRGHDPHIPAEKGDH